MEKRGYLTNDQTGRKEYFVLRQGILRSYKSERGDLLNQIHLAHSGEVNLLHDGILEVRSHAPYSWEYTLGAPSEEDAEHWYDLFQQCIIDSQRKVQNMIELLKNGAQLVKYNYSNYKRTRRLFWINETGEELRWGKAKSVTDFSKVELKDCIGIIYGPVTTTFVRCLDKQDSAECCFSLLFMGRTLDLATYGDMISVWFLGLQYLISRYGSGGPTMPTLSDTQFTIKKVQYKLLEKAHLEQRIYNRYLVDRVKEMAKLFLKNKDEFWKLNKNPNAPMTFSPLPRSPVSPPSGRPSQLPKKTLPSSGLTSSGLPIALPTGTPVSGNASGNGLMQSQQQTNGAMPTVLDEKTKQAMLDMEARLRKVETENEILKASSGGGNSKVDAESAALKYMQTRCQDLEAQVMSMQERIKMQDYGASQDNANLQQAKQNNTKAESEILELTTQNRKLKSQVQAEESKTEKLKTDLSQTEQKIKNLEQSLANEKAAAQSNDKTRVLESANADLSKKVVHLQGQVTAKENTIEMLKKQNDEQKAKNEAGQQRNARLKNEFMKVASKIKDMQIYQAELKTGISVEMRQFLDTYMVPMQRSVKQIANNIASMQDGFKTIQAERRRLHNLVLELKGNIRVFARVRPMSDNEQIDEPKDGTKTVMFSEETKIGVYNDYDARKKWFEFDKCFWPTSTQQEVFEEAMPLATSVLDGYNVCIFAYGQTGSGKTFTMRGPKEDPGLYIRVLQELFRLISEKSQSNRIDLTMMITEIYNESLRDLLSDKSTTKKVDVKLQADGSVGLTNVDEIKVKNIIDVTSAMSRADKNRAVATTDMNEYSSRSHQIVTIKADNESLETGAQYFGKIHLIDLAGSENVGKSGATGQVLKEAQNINKSLSALGDVIQSLQGKNAHVPYRNSKLTMMLKDSLGGDAKMLMIVQCSPAQSNVTETLSTLTFASRARQVELGKAKKNVKQND